VKHFFVKRIASDLFSGGIFKKYSGFVMIAAGGEVPFTTEVAPNDVPDS
jgi:hypothetical protein